MPSHPRAKSTFPSAQNATSVFPFPKVKKSRHDKAMHQPILLIILHLELYIRAMQMRFFLVLYFKLLQWFKGPVISWQGLFMELCGRKGNNKMWRLHRKRKRAVELACLIKPAQCMGLGEVQSSGEWVWWGQGLFCLLKRQEVLGARLKMFASRDLEAVYPYCTEGGGMVSKGW